MPYDLNKRLMKRVEAQKIASKRRRYWLYAASAIAASVLMLLIFHHQDNRELSERQPVVAQQTAGQTKQQVPQQETKNVEQENTTGRVEKNNVSREPIRRVAKAITTRREESNDVSISEEPLLASAETAQDVSPFPSERAEEQLDEEPVISPEKQALVDIFLAEEVLQVAYAMHEQTKPLRAFIATLEGKELETSHHIISF